jgi:Heavy metal associated domain 2
VNGSPRPARVAHHVPGRLRLQLETARGDLPFLVSVAEQIRELPGVEWIRPSPQTGSLVVHYDDEERRGIEEDVRELGARTGLFHLLHISRAGRFKGRITVHPKHGSRFARKLIAQGRELDRNLKRMTDGALDLRSLVPLCLAAASALTARRARAPTPFWVTLAISAFHSFEALNREVAAAEEGFSDPEV